MTGMKFDHVRIEVETTDGPYGFECKFEEGLNIIKGDNSSGKSSLLSSMIYAIGMEEIIGGKGAKVLPYALRSYLIGNDKERKEIVSSYVYLQISNRDGRTVTVKRAIFSEGRSEKLIEVINGPYLSNSGTTFEVSPTYVHDKGSAQIEGAGFFRFLEDFIGFDLPLVPTSSGALAKLYMQNIFAALVVEQKRGWTDYIANTPYYGIREVRTKVVDYILGLNVFENESRRASILSEINSVQRAWSEAVSDISYVSSNNGAVVRGLPQDADPSFDKRLVEIYKVTRDGDVYLRDYLSELISEISELDRLNEPANGNQESILEKYKQVSGELSDITNELDEVQLSIGMSRARLDEYQEMLEGVEEDLQKNKAAQKLKSLGADYSISVSRDLCPSCHQRVDDSLLLADTLAQPMSLSENIKYLESQKRMLSRYIGGIKEEINVLNARREAVSGRLMSRRGEAMDIKRELRFVTKEGEADLKVKVRKEILVEQDQRLFEKVESVILRLEDIAKKLKNLEIDLKKLPKGRLGQKDESKVKCFEEFFKSMAESFGYRSAEISDITINRDNLLPFLSGIELRQVIGDRADLKADSSASDFVRLIWSYLISLFLGSAKSEGNHPGFIVFDEPAQHSMALPSVNSMLATLSKASKLQSIVAASFDQSEEAFRESVRGINYKLIEVGSKLLVPLSKSTV